MIEYLSQLTVSDHIALFSSISSLLIAFVAIWQSHKSIKLTELSISEANRPIVVAYLDIVNIDSLDKFLIIKNFGQTVAIITKIETKNLDVMLDLSSRLETIQNVTFAPNQRLITQLISKYGINANINPFEIKIHYQDVSGKKYVDSFHLNPEYSKAIISSRTKFSKSAPLDDRLAEIASLVLKELK